MGNIKPFFFIFLCALLSLAPSSADCLHPSSPVVLAPELLYHRTNNGQYRVEVKKMAVSSFTGRKTSGRHSLQEVEALLRGSPEVLIAATRMKKSLHLLEEKRASNGWRMNGYVNTGHYRELTDLDRTREFEKLVAGGGVRYPLFGRQRRLQAEILDSEETSRENQFSWELAKTQALQRLRDNYIDYWNATEKLRISRAFLQDEEAVRNFLQKRTETGHLLNADRQGFLTNFEAVKHNITLQKSVMKRTIRDIRLLTRPDYPFFTAVFPQLPPFCNDRAAYKAAMLNQHPQLKIYQGIVETELKIIKTEQYGTVQGSFDLGGHVGLEDITEQTEYGLTAGISVDLPLHWYSAQKAGKEAALTSLREKQLVLKKVIMELTTRAEDLFSDIETAKTRITVSRQRLKAAYETLYKSSLRAKYLPGDMIEKLEQSRYLYYNAAMDYLDTLKQKLHVHAALLALSDDSSQLTKEYKKTTSAIEPDPTVTTINTEYLKPLWIKKRNVKKTTREKAEKDQKIKNFSVMPPPGFGYYVWDSRNLLQQWEEEENFYQILSAMHTRRLLVSFDSRQISEMQQGGATIEKWRLFIEQTAGHGIAVELLLGEPLWILPEYRQNLLEIVQRLNPLPFSGLHLDLELNQLEQKKKSETYLLTQLLQTLEEVIETSPWPVGLSLHPRYLKTKSDICFGCALRNLDVREVVLMSYIANPEKVNENVVPIIKRYPGVAFSIAQSVEPILAREESYFEQGKSVFWKKMDRLQQLLSTTTSCPILIQAFQDFQSMPP
ncbi:MAG: hypothetical protein CSA32_05280 [Desulfobulbus propionicus]|nr:MAG: hypothetical protein CSA32_05280 [Desulfobulbus propionicus]